MSNQEIKVGQVWKANYADATRRVLVILEDRIWYHYIGDGEMVGDLSRDSFRYLNTLIQDAKGNLIKQWKEIDAYEGMILIGTARKDIHCQVRDNTNGKWLDCRLNYTIPWKEFPFIDTSETDWMFCRVEVKDD